MKYEIELFGAWGKEPQDITNRKEFLDFVERHGQGFYHYRDFGDEEGWPQVPHNCYDFSGPAEYHRQWVEDDPVEAVKITIKEEKGHEIFTNHE